MISSKIYAAVTIIIWATMPAIVKLLVTGLPTFEVLGVSSVFAFVFLFALNFRTGTLKIFNRLSVENILSMIFFGFLGLFLYSAFYYYGLEKLSSQEACILNYLWPIMTVIFATPILGEKLTRRKIFAIMLSFSGIVVVMAGNLGTGNFSYETILGAASCILAAACYGLFSVLNKRRHFDQKFTMMIIWLTTALCSIVAGIFFETWEIFGLKELFGLIWLGVATDAIAYLTWALALENSRNTAQIANLAYLVPILAIFVSTFLFGEQLSPAVIPALILILAGIFIQSKTSQ